MKNEFEADSTLDALVEFLRRLPNEGVKMIDFDRSETMMQTAAELKEILAQTHEEGELEISFDDMFNLGSVSVQLSDLTVCNIPQFVKMIEKADNFEIYPKTDGNIQLNITFQSVLKKIG